MRGSSVWRTFLRPVTRIATLGSAILSAVAQVPGMPEPWSVVVFGTLLAACVAIVTKASSLLTPLVVFVAVLATHAARRRGGMATFLALECALLTLAIVL